jgi:hypothetical protein
MRNLIIILFLFCSTILNGQNVYWLTPRGNDGNDGSDSTAANAWLTIEYAVGQLTEGDTLRIREGTYYRSAPFSIGSNDGTSGNPIVVMGCEGDDKPIIDATNREPGSCVWITDASYWTFKRLIFQHALQGENTTERAGVLISGSDHIVFDEVESRYNEGQGFKIEQGSDEIRFTNCDAYSNYNWYAVAPSKPGGAAGGFVFISTNHETDTTNFVKAYFDGCRAWRNSDNGISSAYGTYMRVENCWAFVNGWQAFDPEDPLANGDGRGFPAGMISAVPPDDQYIYKNNIAAYNKGPGYNINSNSYPHTGSFIYYNNIAHNNREYGFTGNYQTYSDNIIYRNNVSVFHGSKIAWNQGDAAFSLEPGITYTSDHNSWDASVDIDVIEADFLDLPADSAECVSVLAAARQADGSLPDIGNYYKPSSTSQLIDIGTDTIASGIVIDSTDFTAPEPDLGVFEYSEQNPAVAPTVTTGQAYNISTTGCIVIGNNNDDGGGTVSQKGVCWSTSTDPTTADDKTEEGAGAGDFTSTITGLDEGTTYYVRAYATNEVDTSYGDNVSFTTRKGGVIIGGDGNVTFIKGKIYIKK